MYKYIYILRFIKICFKKDVKNLNFTGHLRSFKMNQITLAGLIFFYWIHKNMQKPRQAIHLYINLACLSVCFFVCLFVWNKRQNGWTDRAQIFCGTLRDPREGLRMIKIKIFFCFVSKCKQKVLTKIQNLLIFYQKC